jgi:hypothetical protein
MYLADMLGVAPVTLGFGEAADVGTELDIVSYLVLADRALHTREWVTALDATLRAEEMALATDRLDRAWEAQYLRCRILVEKSDFSDAAELVLQLCDGVVTNQSVTVHAEVLNLAARILRGVRSARRRGGEGTRGAQYCSGRPPTSGSDPSVVRRAGRTW